MKKYTYSLLLIGFIVLVFIWRGTAYLTNQAETEEFVPLYIETEFETRDVWSGVEIEAADYSHPGELSSFYLVHNETAYTPTLERSSLDSYFDPYLDELVGQHRSFFRGKQFTHSFYVDDTFIISAETKTGLLSTSPEVLSIDLLERQNEITLSFSTQFSDDLFSSYIVDIQLHQAKLYVAIEELRYSENSLVMYEFAINDPSSVNRKELFKRASADSIGMFQVAEKATYTGSVYFNSYFPPSSYLSWYSVQEDELNNPYSYSNKPYELFSYAYGTGEIQSSLVEETLDLAKSEDSWWAVQDHDQLILLEPYSSEATSETGYVYVPLNQLENIHYHPLPAANYHSTQQMIHGLIYQLALQPTSTSEIALITVFDPKTNDLVYKGSIQSEDSLFASDDYNFDFVLLPNNSLP